MTRAGVTPLSLLYAALCMTEELSAMYKVGRHLLASLVHMIAAGCTSQSACIHFT